jgi:hypothetical protein
MEISEEHELQMCDKTVKLKKYDFLHEVLQMMSKIH